jgi:hypothetical protein
VRATASTLLRADGFDHGDDLVACLGPGRLDLLLSARNSTSVAVVADASCAVAVGSAASHRRDVRRRAGRRG